MARITAIGLVVVLIAILFIIYMEEEILPKTWVVRLEVKPYELWIARWIDVLVQVMILLLAMIAVSHLVRGDSK